MNPIALGEPAVEPVGLDEAKAYLRLDGDDEDELVSALISAGRMTVEGATRLVLVEQPWRVRLRAWPSSRAVDLPLGPVLSVDAVRLVSAAGEGGTVGPELYRLASGSDPVRLLIDPAAPDPGAGEEIAIDLTCGFGSGPGSVPEPLRLAVRRLVAHWFERRGDEDAHAGPGLPAELAALVAPFVRRRLA